MPNSHQSTERKLRKLISRSLDILEAALDNSSIPAETRADLALQILDLAAMELEVETDSSFHNEASASVDLPHVSNRSSGKHTVKSQQIALPKLQSLREKTAPPNPQGTSLAGAHQPVVTHSEITHTSPYPLASDSIILPAESVQIDNFLSPIEYEEVLQTALRRSHDFVSTSTVGDVSNYRQSSVLWGKCLPELHSMMRKRILSHLPSVLEQLKLSSFLVSKVEMQMTAHHDGCFYKVHTDASSESTQARQLTYVYYFYREPKAFTGGELKLYETELRGQSSNSCATHKTIEPRNNSIVFFNSRCRHEVLPVSCPSQDFADGRFTLNGWVRRVDMEPVQT